MPLHVDESKTKIIRDVIHGYIQVSVNEIENFIDTPQFQRLIGIQQTNLSVLFPSATHTRFQHSLGVFHLGRQAFDAIAKNSESISDSQSFKKNFRNTVLLACLLHDIGHAPFSHIGEEFYVSNNIQSELKKEGIDLAGCPRTPAPHEFMSCLVALKIFGDTLSRYEKFDKELFCRLITGVEYPAEDSDAEVKNCLIQVLNSSFDVDKMDYIMRDSFSAGITIAPLDLPRIINSMAIKDDEGKKRFVFTKPALSVINNIINARNSLYFWFYGHHKIVYHFTILSRYIEEFIESNKDMNVERLFSFEAITGEVSIDYPPDSSRKYKYKYVNDGDLLNILKYAPDYNPNFYSYYDQLFNRNHYKSIWKTPKDFKLKLEEDRDLATNYKNICIALEAETIEDRVLSKFKGKGKVNKGDFYIEKVEPKIHFPEFHEKIFFYFPDRKEKFKRYGEIFGTPREGEVDKDIAFNIFIRKEKESYIDDIIEQMRKI